jgi:uncharacterized protein (DUF934 family)
MSTRAQSPQRRIIRDQDIVHDEWIYLGDQQDPPRHASSLLLSVRRFLEEANALIDSGHRVGVRLEAQHTGRELGHTQSRAELIAVDFPKFTDGRGYTIAQRLRTQLGWSGRLRAVGDVLPDQAFYLRRCGFDELDVRADKSIEDAHAALGTFSVVYQGAASDPRPLYRRRA